MISLNKTNYGNFGGKVMIELKPPANLNLNKQIIFTVGYTLFQNGNYVDLEKMFNVLRNYNVTYLVDVRSVPYSKQYPQCNADNLKIAGKRYGIPYLHMPEVGAKVSAEQDVFSKASDIFFNDIS